MEKNKHKIMIDIKKESISLGDQRPDFTTELFVASKTTPITNPKEGIPSSLLRKISLAKELDNDYIVRLQDIQKDKHELKLVFENLGSDTQLSYQEYQMPYDTSKLLLHHIIRGINYLHSLELVHGDLRPDCVLVDFKENIIKIVDAVSVKPIALPLTDQIVTPMYKTDAIQVANFKYKAPETLLGDTKLSTAIDMWAFGCMLAELVTMRPLFPGESAEDVLREIFRFLGVPNEDSWPGVTSLPNFNAQLYNPEDRRDLSNTVGLNGVGLDLLSKLLCLNPAERMAASDVLAHPFFEGQ